MGVAPPAPWIRRCEEKQHKNDELFFITERHETCTRLLININADIILERKQEIRSDELGVCPMQLLYFWSRDVHPVQNLLLCTKFHRNRMIFRRDISPVAKPQIFGQPCNTVRTVFFCCFYTSEMCSLRIWMMPLCHPWAIRRICKLRPPLLKNSLFVNISVTAHGIEIILVSIHMFLGVKNRTKQFL